MRTGPRVIGHIWETPVIVRGNTWLPATQIGAFLAMFWYGKARYTNRGFPSDVLVWQTALA
jgi:hypothetical protein